MNWKADTLDAVSTMEPPGIDFPFSGHSLAIAVEAYLIAMNTLINY